MKTSRSTLRTMRLVILVCQLGLILRTEAQIPDACTLSSTNRPPQNTDITVICGTEYMDVSIYLCPVYQSRYNESLMVPNHQTNTPECLGTADFSVDPPVLKYRFPLNETALSSCSNVFTVTTETGNGEFADFSNVQFVNISGIITSEDPSKGTITYRTQILYKYSCFYPMQYVVNNTELAVSGASVAIRDNNGSFITTLSMELYSDELYQNLMIIPDTGLNLKTKIYVAVKATNLTDRFNVLLDRCYATTSPYLIPSTYYDLFIGCTRDAQTQVKLNGKSQIAQFVFEAFRFVEHKDKTVSVFYLHCVTRLCEVASCSSFLPACDTVSVRRKREAEESELGVNTTVSSSKITVGSQTNGEDQSATATHNGSSDNNYSGPVVAVIVCIIILTIIIAAMAVYFGLYIRQRKPSLQ